MQRRKLLAGAAASAFAADSDWPDPFARAWRDSFLRHWADTREYTLAMMEAMPADGFDSKPNPEQRAFGEQFIHIGRANNAYMAAFGIAPAPAAPAGWDKEACRKFLAASFDYSDQVLRRITGRDLARQDLKIAARLPPHSGTDLCMRAYMHTAHHRGQAVVYLRVRGIVPPTWKFEPTGA
jgi:uncharacterized damage-inducible protein DinB